MAGSEQSGAAHAKADLFDGKIAILTPTKNTRAEDFDALERFWSSLGSVVLQMPPEDHDRALALTSHLPHALASCLTAVVPESLFRLVGTGFLDTTRVAGGEPGLWRQVFQSNRRNMLACLQEFDKRLSELRDAITRDDGEELERLLAVAKKNRDALGS